MWQLSYIGEGAGGGCQVEPAELIWGGGVNGDGFGQDPHKTMRRKRKTRQEPKLAASFVSNIKGKIFEVESYFDRSVEPTCS